MKKKSLMAGMLVLFFALCFPLCVEADQDILMLPSKMKVVKKEAFANDKSITSVMIPKSVESIQSKAFAGCVNLKEVILGNNSNLSIAPDAFSGCGDIHFQAFPDTAGELYALSHGFSCDLLEEGSSFLEKALELVTAHGGTTSILQSADFMTMRLIVRMGGNHLPDISAYSPEKILQEGDGVFFVQFGSVEDTIDAYNALKGNAGVVFVENDACVEVIEDVIDASSVDANVWDTKDPMGFEAYAPYVAEQNSGRTLIAVIDSGVQKNAAYSDRLRTDGISLVSGDPEWSNDKLLHGSMIAGIIGDCAGDTGVEILPVRVVSESGVANLTMIGLGIKYAISRGVDVINLSLNFEENDYVSYWIDKAVAAGIDVVTAAGNSKRDISKIYPANVQGVIAVSGIDNDYELSNTSNYGANITFCAPDSYVTTSAYPSMVRKGTSFGAPMVATALALVKLDKNHTEEDLPVICRRLKDVIPDVNNYGYGLMQLDKLAGSGSYTITYNANGGTGAPESQIKTPGVDLVLSTTKPTRTCTVTLDYGTGTTDKRTVKAAFAGWKAEGSGTKYSAGATYAEDATDTLYAQWTYGTLGTLSSPVRDGYSFYGWYTAKTGGNAVSESTKVTKNMTIYAQWKKIYTITYNANGGTGEPESQIKTQGVDLVLSTAKPTRICTVTLDYGTGTTDKRTVKATFAGWKAEGSGTKYSAGATYADDAADTLYAQWTYGALGALPSPARDGYSFEGWYTAKTGGNAVTEATKITKNMTIYAQWKEHFTITIDVQDRDRNSDGTYTVEVGAQVQLNALVTPADADQEVTWSVQAQIPQGIVSLNEDGLLDVIGIGSVIVGAQAENGVMGYQTIHTIMLPESVTISGDTSVRLDQTLQLSAEVLPASADDKTVLWKSSNSSVATVDKNGIVSPVATGTVTITALCRAKRSVKDQKQIEVKPAVYQIVFDGNGGTAGIDSMTATCGEAIGNMPSADRPYYTFAGWYDEINGGNLVSAASSFDREEPLTLYARWRLNDFGSWSGWSTTAVASDTNRQVETRSVTDYGTKTVYSYSRFTYLHTSGKWYSTWWDCSGQSYYSSGGMWEYCGPFDSPLGVRQVFSGGQVEYNGSRTSSCANVTWYNQSASQQSYVTGSHTEYRYRDRMK